MSGNTLRLGRLFGIEVKLDYSWFIIFALVTWSLARQYFPMAHPGWSATVYWAMGALTALLFFTSVLAHELAHSFVAQAQGTPVRDITLFLFGGAAHISEEPKSPRHEFLMALAGPVTSLMIAGLFGLVWQGSLTSNPLLHALAGWLATINLSLGLFNLIPGFPLDGGRVFRAIVWHITGNLQRGTAIAGGLGRFVAYGFIFWGVWQIFSGNWVNGLWIAFIGWFLENAATASVQQVALHQWLTGHTVREVMMTDCPQLLGQLTLDVAVDQVVLPSGKRCFPVIEQGQVQGLLTLHRIASAPRDQWATTRVQDVMIPLAELKTVRPDEELVAVFERMAEEDINQYPVLEAGNRRLLGIVARDNVLTFLHTRAALRA